jgi:hypothetical protein
MPSTDIDSSPVVIFSAEDATRIYNKMREIALKYGIEQDVQIVNRIARDLNLTPIEVGR